MKAISAAILLSASLFISSCGSNSTTTGNINGTWDATLSSTTGGVTTENFAFATNLTVNSAKRMVRSPKSPRATTQAWVRPGLGVRDGRLRRRAAEDRGSSKVERLPNSNFVAGANQALPFVGDFAELAVRRTSTCPGEHRGAAGLRAQGLGALTAAAGIEPGRKNTGVVQDQQVVGA